MGVLGNGARVDTRTGTSLPPPDPLPAEGGPPLALRVGQNHDLQKGRVITCKSLKLEIKLDISIRVSVHP